MKFYEPLPYTFTVGVASLINLVTLNNKYAVVRVLAPPQYLGTHFTYRSNYIQLFTAITLIKQSLLVNTGWCTAYIYFSGWIKLIIMFLPPGKKIPRLFAAERVALRCHRTFFVRYCHLCNKTDSILWYRAKIVSHCGAPFMSNTPAAGVPL